jgi:cytidyltransferase-like protein
MENYPRFKLAVTFGRFNHLHIGHLDLFRQMHDASDEMIIGMSNNLKNQSYKDRAQVIAQAIKEDGRFTRPYQILPKAQPFELTAELKMYNPEDCVFYLGQDQFELAKAVERVLGVATVLIPRLTSSTTVRALIDEEEWSLLSSIVPISVLSKVVRMHQSTCQNSL